MKFIFGLYLISSCQIILSQQLQVTEKSKHAQQLHSLAISTLQQFENTPKINSDTQNSLNFYFQYVLNQFPLLNYIKSQISLKTSDKIKTQNNHDLNIAMDITLNEIPQILPNDPKDLKRSKAIILLEIAAYKMNYMPSLAVLGDMNLFQAYSHPRNTTKALYTFTKMAELGNSTAQRIVGLMYASSIGTDRNYAKAQLYISFAALGGDTMAEQILGFWHLQGISIAKSCSSASFYYLRIAKKAIEKYKSGPPLGYTLPDPPIKLPEILSGGIYGPGASGSGDPSRRDSLNPALSTSDILEFYILQADAGDPAAQLLVGQILYQGADDLSPDFTKSRKYLLLASKPSTLQKLKKKSDISIQGQALSLIGQMYWRGEGVELNNNTARKWYERGALFKNPAALYALGLMHEDGSAGFETDKNKAIYYYKEAAAFDNANALNRLGELDMLDDPVKNSVKAYNKFTRAASKGNLNGIYNLAKLFLSGQGVPENCQAGVKYLKNLVEKADWHQPYIHEAYKHYSDENFDTSLLYYIFSAESGYETAQTNAAWMIDKDIISRETLEDLFSQNVTNIDKYKLAYPLWNRAANQGNVDARVKIGDYFYNGYLSDENNSTEDRYLKAASYYRIAAEQEYSSMAMWNIAWMYEYGLGVEKDFHISKRMYDLCLSTNPGGYFPVQLALFKLWFKSIWKWVSDFSSSKKGTSPIHESEDKTNDETFKVYSDEDEAFMNDTDEGGENALIVVLVLMAALLLYGRHRIVERREEDIFVPLDDEHEAFMENLPQEEFEEESPVKNMPTDSSDEGLRNRRSNANSSGDTMIE